VNQGLCWILVGLFLFNQTVFFDLSYASSPSLDQKNILLSWSEFNKLKPNLQITYLREVQKLLTETADDSSVVLFYLNRILPQNFYFMQLFSLETAEGASSEEDDTYALRDKLDRLMGNNGYFKSEGPVENVRIYKENQEKINKLLDEIEVLSKTFATGDIAYKQIYIENSQRLAILKSRYKNMIKDNEAGILLARDVTGNAEAYLKTIERAEKNINEVVQKYQNEPQVEELKRHEYRCIYAGFVSRKKTNSSKCHPINRTTLFKDTTDEKSLKCTDPKKPILCNPLLFGYKAHFADKVSICNQPKIPLTSSVDNDPFCVSYGSSASAQCQKISDKENGLCVARAYIKMNPTAWGDLNTQLNLLCGSESPNRDLQGTCDLIRERIVKIGISVQAGYLDFASKDKVKQPATQSGGAQR
jgi:hypothetical protein